MTRKLVKNSINYKIGLLGGSFDPPHAGHLFISHDAIERFDLDEVWWIVAKQNTLKKRKASNFNQRINLCRELLENQPKISVQDLEKNVTSNDTIDVLNYIITKNKDDDHSRQYFWIMGSDSFHSFNQWPKWQEILKLVKIIVYDRKNFEFKEKKINSILKQYSDKIKEFKHKQPPSWTLVKIKTPNISSTEIRSTHVAN